jgi:hypothetical protein
MNDFTQIGVAGDWHANTGWSGIALQIFANHGIKHILHLGDFGFWPGNNGKRYRHKVNKRLRDNEQTLYVTLGNHEDYSYTNRLKPHPTLPGWRYNPSEPHILVAERGTRWEWEGVSFVSLGGANSIDYDGRIRDVSWWTDEQIQLDDIMKTIMGGHADIMLTHDCPTGVNLFAGRGFNPWPVPNLRYAQKSRDALRQAVDGVKPELLLHGHYHFLADHYSTLHDGVEEYALHSIGLDMDSTPENLAILSLPDKTLELIKLQAHDIPSEYTRGWDK